MNIVDVLLRGRVILFLPLTIFGQMAPPFALETEDCLDIGLSYPIYCPVINSSSQPELYQNERNQNGGPQRTNLGL